MTDGSEFLSQEELDALLGAINAGQDSPSEKKVSSENLNIRGISPEEADMIGEVGNMIMGSASTALFAILGKEVDITIPRVSVIKLRELQERFKEKKLVTSLDFIKGINGMNILVVDLKTASIIGDLMMGGTGDNADLSLDDIKISAVAEAMNQMMGAASTAMSEFLSTAVNISPPNVKILDFSDPNSAFPPIVKNKDEDVVLVSFDMEIKNLSKTEIFQVLPISFVKNLYRKVAGDSIQEKVEPINEPQQSANTPDISPTSRPGQQRSDFLPPPPPKQKPVSVKPVEFENFGETQYASLPKQLELLYDVPLEITVELGRCRMPLKEVIELSIGSIVELDKLTGEHVDILVNGKIIAKGEVVVVGESFGIRVLEIVNPAERVRSLK